MKKPLTLLTAICVLIASLMLSACGSSGLSEDEIRTVCKDLTEASYALNDVYYGDGLPYTKDDAILEELLGFSPDDGGLVLDYYPVTADAAFQSEDEIRAATKAVFSPAMCEMLYEIGFSGVSTEDESKVAFARYIQQGEYLTVRIGLDTDAVDVGRTYDFSSMTVLINETNRIRVEVLSEVDGKPSVKVKITMIKTENGWRLDSPTY